MRFVSNPTTPVLTDGEFTEAIGGITQQLAACRQDGYFESREGKQLYYEYFLAENSKGSVVVVHGLSEFTKKYYEIAYYLLNQGFNVFLYDQRGHGLSFRMTEPVDLLHVDRFCDYVTDLERFIDLVVRPADPKPLYLYAHSMGGAVAAWYMADHPEQIRRAVLAAPMIEPIVKGATVTKARIGVGLAGLFRGWKTRFWGSRDFDPNIPYNKLADPSESRSRYNLAMRCAEVRYQSTPMSLGWLYNSLSVRPKLMAMAGKISTPILLLSGSRDQVVNNQRQAEFAAKCPSCTMVTLEDAPHALLVCGDGLMEQHIRYLTDFLNNESII